MSEGGRPPTDFAAVLANPDPRPLIVGGQAVNIWAEIYAPDAPELSAFVPFTSRDADVHGDRELARLLHERTGWDCRFYDDVRQIAVALLTKKPATTEEPPLIIEVIRAVTGLTPDDLGRSQTRELRPGEFYRVPTPLVLLKAKLTNLVSLAKLDRPQDLKHVRMLLPICRAFLLEMHADIGRPDMSERNFIGALNYAKAVVTTSDAESATATHGLALWSIFPSTLARSPHEKVRNFAVHQLPQ